MSKYFNVIVKPTISVAALNAGNITANEVLFDWHGFDIPKGAARLAGCTILYNGKNGAKYTATDFEVYWAKGDPDGTGPASLGDDGAAVDTFGWWNNIQGKMTVDASDGASAGNIIVGEVLSTQNPTAESVSLNNGFNSDLVLQGEPNSGTNVGFDKLFIGAIALATHNWGPSTLTVDGTMVTTSPTLTVADVDALKAVGPGDILKDEDDNLLGTVKTVDSATQITMKSNLASASANDKLVFNTTPITFILSFEQ
tara:strand:+ start:329 stop:1093 length:765 start_codon:yes stop_codon:yes gene_type:complete